MSPAPPRARPLRSTQSLLPQTAQTPGCNRRHAHEERCARWLLKVHDRVPGDAFRLTQEALGLLEPVLGPPCVAGRAD